MERSVTDITLDLQRSFAPGEITVRRGDTHRTLRFFLADGGKPYKPTDVRAVLTAQKPDGTHIFNECTVAEDRVLYDLTSQTTACPGQVECQLRLYGAENALLHTAAFTLTVEDTVYTEGDEEITSGDEATALTKLITQTEQKLVETEEALESIAPLRKHYELIEEITLEEAVTSFMRTADTNGVTYDFSAIRAFVKTPANPELTGSGRVVFSTKSGSKYKSYTWATALSKNAETQTAFMSRNDHGMLEDAIWSVSYDDTAASRMRPSYIKYTWTNIDYFVITPQNGQVLPAGTTISIYAVRG